MRERLRPILENLATFVAPGLVLLLLAIQVAFGVRGFDRPDESFLQVLQVPGVLLGWGGVALLLPLLVWMILDWWGYDLGGFALKGLGSAVLGIATGALCGLVGDVAAGGIVGGGLAGVLKQTVGPDIAFAVLALMAIPATILAFSMQKRAERPARGQAAQMRQETGRKPKYGFWAHVRGVFGGRKQRDPAADTWYPERRFDEHGNELPMEFGRQRDVGDIRYADEEPEAEPDAQPVTAPEVAPEAAPKDETPPLIADLLEDEERLPTIPELLAGNYPGGRAGSGGDPSGGPREVEADLPDDGPVHVGSDGRPLQHTTGTRAQAPAPRAEVEEEPVPEDAAQQHLAFAPAPERSLASDSALPPGVRWADEPAPPEPEEDDAEESEDAPADLPALSAALENAVRGPAADPDDAAHTARSVRETLRQKVEAIRSDGASSRYMAKLEAIGLFDPAEPAAEPPPKKKAARKRPAKRKPAKKKAGKKKAAKKQATKGQAGRRTSAATRAPARKKAAARKRPAAKRPTAAQRAEAAERRRRKALVETLRAERLDPLFARAVHAALERGAASPVLLTRRLGLPFARAQQVVTRMVEAGVLAEASPSGSHALLVTRKEWEASAS